MNLRNISGFLSDLFSEPKLALFGRRDIFMDDNTFIVWEPCSVSHSEVVPGYAKYLSDLGYTVSVVVSPKSVRDGLFDLVKDKNIHVNYISRGAAFRFFSQKGIGNAKGILITTAGKISKKHNYNAERNFFANLAPNRKALFVEHKIDVAVDNGNDVSGVIALRKMDYKDATPVAVNPNYFGEIPAHKKSADFTRFVLVGALQPHKRSDAMVVEAAERLAKKGANFEILVIGKGSMPELPKTCKKFFKFCGAVPFRDMYRLIESADFFLTPFKLPEQKRYITSGTSGSFQLIYGFAKPCVICADFAKINRFDAQNSVICDSPKHYPEAVERAAKMTVSEYESMQKNLENTVSAIRADSIKNLADLIKKDNTWEK